MNKNRFILILVTVVMIFFLIILPKNTYAEIGSINQVVNDCCSIELDLKPMENNNNYSVELLEMWTHDTANSQKMTYMDYRAITDTSSKQYKLQQDPYCVIDEQGFLIYRDNWYVVAMGSYWGKVGDKFVVYLDNGEIIPVILGDIKADRHTDKENYAHKTDGHVLEFLIDSSSSYMKNVGITKYGLINKVFKEWDSKIVGLCKIKEDM